MPNADDILDRFRNIRINKLNNLYGQVLGDAEIVNALIKHFSVEVPKARFMPKVKAGVWDGKIRFVTYDGKFAIGLFTQVRDIITQWNEDSPDAEKKKIIVDPNFDISEDITDLEDITDKYLNTGKLNFCADPPPGEPNHWIPRDYQWNMSNLALSHKQCLVISATASGKTLMLAMICNYLLQTDRAKRILVIVPKIDLVVQGKMDLKMYGIPEKDIGMVFGEIKEYDRLITISTFQSVNLDDTEYFKQFDAFICDEVHGAKAKTDGPKGNNKQQDFTIMRKIVEKCVNSEYRIGLTGTLPDEKVHQYAIIGGFGPVVGKIKNIELMDKGYISKLKIIVTFLKYPKHSNKKIREITDQILQDSGKGTLKEVEKIQKENKETIILGERWRAENEYLMKSIQRNKFLCKVVRRRLEKNENILILVDEREHGKIVHRVLEKLCPTASAVFYIDGEVPVKKRKESREFTEANDRVITIATLGVYSTGINIKKLHTIIFFSGGQAKIRTLQAVGRSLRKHESKDRALLIDICDNLYYSLKHTKERLRFYSDEEFDVAFKEFEFKDTHGFV